MEYLDIVDENNNLTGIVEERKIAHEKHLWHRHVTSWIMNKEGKILLQKRAACKERNPNKWAKTGGHIEDFTLQKEEVSEVRYFTIEELEEIKKENNPNYNFTLWGDEAFNREIKLLKKKRNEILKY